MRIYTRYLIPLALAAFLLTILSLPARAAGEKLICNATIYFPSTGASSVEVIFVINDADQTVNDVPMHSGEHITILQYDDNEIRFTDNDNNGFRSSYTLNRLDGTFTSTWYEGGGPFTFKGTCTKAKQKF